MASASASQPKPDRIAAGFHGTLAKTPLNRGAQLRLLLGAGLALILPLTYLGLAGGFAYLTFSHLLLALSDNLVISVPWLLTQLLLPAASCAAVVMLWLRPFLRVTPDRHPPSPLPQAQAPELYTLVTLIAEALGSPKPAALCLSMRDELRVDHRRNRQTRRSETVLVVGLPMVAALSSGQLASMIAQTLAPQATPLSRQATRLLGLLTRFYRASLDGSDGWQHTADRLSRRGEDNSLLGAVALVIQAGLWLSNVLLGTMQRAHRLLTAPAMRLLRRDADLAAAQLAGSEQYAEALTATQALRAEWQSSYHALATDDATTPDDFPRFVAIKIQARAGKRAQPANSRAQAARNELCRGVLTLSFPALDLLQDAQSMCRQHTRVFYREMGLDVHPEKLQAVVVDTRRHRIEQHLFSQLAHYTASVFFEDAVWDIKQYPALAELSDAERIQAVQDVIQTYRAALPDASDAATHIAHCRDTHIERLLLPIKHASGLISDDMLAHQTQTLTAAQKRLAAYSDQMGQWSRRLGKRVCGSIQLLQDPQQQRKGQMLLQCLHTLKQAQGHVHIGIIDCTMAEKLQSMAPDLASDAVLEHLQRHNQRLQTHNAAITTCLARLPASVRALSPLPAAHDAPTTQFKALNSAFCELNRLLSGQLASLAIPAEQAHAIEPVRLIPPSGTAHAA